MSSLEDYLNVDHFYLINRLLFKLIGSYQFIHLFYSFILTSYFIAVRNTRKEYRP